MAGKFESLRIFCLEEWTEQQSAGKVPVFCSLPYLYGLPLPRMNTPEDLFAGEFPMSAEAAIPSETIGD